MSSLDAAVQFMREQQTAKQQAREAQVQAPAEQAPPAADIKSADVQNTATQDVSTTKPAESASPHSSLALLAKQEAAARNRERELNAKLQELEAKHRAADARAQELSSKWDTLKQNPNKRVEILDDELGSGWYQQVSSQLLGKTVTPDEQLRLLQKKYEDLEKSVDDRAMNAARSLLSEQQKEQIRQQQLKEYIQSGYNLAKEASDLPAIAKLTKNEEKFKTYFYNALVSEFHKTGIELTPSEIIVKLNEEYGEFFDAPTASSSKTEQASHDAPRTSASINSGMKTTTAVAGAKTEGPDAQVSAAARLLAEMVQRRQR